MLITSHLLLTCMLLLHPHYHYKAETTYTLWVRIRCLSGRWQKKEKRKKRRRRKKKLSELTQGLFKERYFFNHSLYFWLNDDLFPLRHARNNYLMLFFFFSLCIMLIIYSNYRVIWMQYHSCMYETCSQWFIFLYVMPQIVAKKKTS